MKPKKRHYNYPEDTTELLNKGFNDIIFIFKCIDRVRVKRYFTMKKAEFVRDVLNKDRIRVKYNTFVNMSAGAKRRITDFDYLPNFFFVPNILEPLNLTLQELFEQYGHD